MVDGLGKLAGGFKVAGILVVNVRVILFLYILIQ